MTYAASLLGRIGWNASEVARRLGCSPSLPAGWVRGDAETPPFVIGWLERVAKKVESTRPPIRDKWARPRFEKGGN